MSSFLKIQHALTDIFIKHKTPKRKQYSSHMIKYSTCQSVHRQPLAKPVISVAKSKEHVIVYLQMHVNDLLSFTSLYYFHSAMITCDSCSKNIFLNRSGYSHTFFPELTSILLVSFHVFLAKVLGNKTLVYQILKT